MNEIDLSNIPVEPTVEILDPVRNSNGKIIPIDSKGRISDLDNLTGEKHEQFLISLLSP